MPAIRKFSSDITFDEAEDEVFFTRAALKADPDAAEFLALTTDWLPMVDAARAKEREARVASMDATALRIIANHQLDRECTAFGDDLYLAVGKDRNSPRWRQFFSTAVSRFVKMRFAKQVQTVKGWLSSSVNDPVLDRRRDALAQWTELGAQALAQTAGVALVRGAARIGREQLAEDLTRERDGLYEALSARARDLGLPRDWARQFFRVGVRRTGASEGDTEGNGDGDGAPDSTEG